MTPVEILAESLCGHIPACPHHTSIAQKQCNDLSAKGYIIQGVQRREAVTKPVDSVAKLYDDLDEHLNETTSSIPHED